MRWIVRDLGVFVYGCIFAGKCVCCGFFGQPERQSKTKGTESGVTSSLLVMRPTLLRTSASNRGS